MIHIITASSFFLLFFLTVTASYAVDPKFHDERDSRRTMRQEQRPQVQQYAPGPEYVRERKEQQRRESQNPGQDSSGFRTPQTVNIDRLKLRSNALSEYQFESVPTMTLQSPNPAPHLLEQPQQNKADTEEVQQEQSSDENASYETPTPEMTAEIAPAKEQTITASGGSSFKIIEEENRIVVLQVDAAPATVTQTR